MAVKIYNVYTRGMRIKDGVFTTPELLSDKGVYFPEYGGYYAGGNIIVDGTEYYIIIAPKTTGEDNSIRWKTTLTSTSGATSTYDGKANMSAIISAGISNHPAADFCNNLNINGFNDWHLPAPDEIEVCYRFLKPSTQDNNTSEGRLLHNEINGYNPNSNPTEDGYELNDPSQTTVTEFQEGNSQAFVTSYYWTSMDETFEVANVMNFHNGSQYSIDITGTKTDFHNCRAVRWVEV